MGDAIITNPLDEQQHLAILQKESARRHTQLAAILEGRRGYVFAPLNVKERNSQTAGRSLATWAIGTEPISPEWVAIRQALREKYLEPYLTT